MRGISVRRVRLGWQDSYEGTIGLWLTWEGNDLWEFLLQGSAAGDAKSLQEQLEVLQESIGDIRNREEASCSTSEEGRARYPVLRHGGGGFSLRKACEVVQEVVLPVFVVVLGVGFSLAALYVAMASAIWPDMSPNPDRI